MHCSTGIAWLSSVRNESCHVKLCLTNETHVFNYKINLYCTLKILLTILEFDERVDNRQVIMILI